jgi:anti-sigma factor RsiW
MRVRSLETAMRSVGGWCEMVASLGVSWSNELVVRQSLASKDVNTEAEEAMALEAVTRRRPVKIQQTKKTLYVLQ